ncbi:MAG TPA: hypothetical protein VGN17_01065 [Bryobacteraceae bacterium]|jgi:hypothetical protein
MKLKELCANLKQAARDYEAASSAKPIDATALLIASENLKECEILFMRELRQQASTEPSQEAPKPKKGKKKGKK